MRLQALKGGDTGAHAKQRLCCWLNNLFHTGWGLPLARLGVVKMYCGPQVVYGLIEEELQSGHNCRFLQLDC